MAYLYMTIRDKNIRKMKKNIKNSIKAMAIVGVLSLFAACGTEPKTQDHTEVVTLMNAAGHDVTMVDFPRMNFNNGETFVLKAGTDTTMVVRELDGDGSVKSLPAMFGLYKELTLMADGLGQTVMSRRVENGKTVFTPATHNIFDIASWTVKKNDLTVEYTYTITDLDFE